MLSYLLLSFQLSALRPNVNVLAKRNVAALALELGVNDISYLKALHPRESRLVSVAAMAKSRELSVFGVYPLLKLHEQLGTYYESEVLNSCIGSLGVMEAVEGDAGFVRVKGWVFEAKEGFHRGSLNFLTTRTELSDLG